MSSDDNEEVKEDVKKRYYNFMRFFFKPYEDFLEIFKTHRPIKLVDYQFGFSRSLEEKSQLIVHEFNERSKVREYFKVGTNVWKCCECNQTTSHESDTAYLLLINGVVFVKIDHNCKPRDFLYVQQIQKFYKELETLSIFGSDDFSVIADLFVNTHREIVAAKAEEPFGTTATSIFVFEKPLTSMLKEICAKLKINYSIRAITLWDQIMIKRIDTVTPPKQILIHHLETKNFFQILSKFFAGKIN